MGCFALVVSFAISSLYCCLQAQAGIDVPPDGGGGGAPAVPELDPGLLALIGTAVSAGVVGLRQKFKQKR